MRRLLLWCLSIFCASALVRNHNDYTIEYECIEVSTSLSVECKWTYVGCFFIFKVMRESFRVSLYV